MKISIYVLLMFLVFFSCKEPKARRPKEHSVTNFHKEIIAHNKKMNAIENKRINYFISKDSIYNYISSSNGFWYAYIDKDTLGTKTPKLNDLVTLEYDISSLNNQLIYEKKQITYKVDKQDFIPGLQEGIKLMKEGEKLVFIIPSYKGFGITGDGDKIKINQTIKSTLKLIQITNNK